MDPDLAALLEKKLQAAKPGENLDQWFVSNDSDSEDSGRKRKTVARGKSCSWSNSKQRKQSISTSQNIKRKHSESKNKKKGKKYEELIKMVKKAQKPAKKKKRCVLVESSSLRHWPLGGVSSRAAQMQS